MSKQAENFFKQMVGNWGITRIFMSRRENVGNATGVANITKLNPTTLQYKEELDSTLYGNKIKTHQQYKFVFEDGRLIKKFDEPTSDRLFYELNFIDERKATGKHLCVCDEYTATYNILGEDNFTITYDVLGPKKDDSIITDFHRLTGECDYNNE